MHASYPGGSKLRHFMNHSQIVSYHDLELLVLIVMVLYY